MQIKFANKLLFGHLALGLRVSPDCAIGAISHGSYYNDILIVGLDIGLAYVIHFRYIIYSMYSLLNLRPSGTQ